MSEKNGKNGWSLKAALLESWIGLGSVAVFFVGALLKWGPGEMSGGGWDDYLIQIALLAGAVAAMNGFAKTDLAVKMSIWSNHWVFKPIHFVTEEGELAGIMVGCMSAVAMFCTGNGDKVIQTVAHSYHLSLTLLGIMSAANLAVLQIRPIMLGLEDILGTRVAVILGCLLSMFTGEPAAAVFLTDFILERVPEDKRPIVAAGLAAAIGSGGGPMPFAAPPILIIWVILNITLGWGIPDLMMYVGGGCLLHVIISSFWFVKYLEEKPKKRKPVVLTAANLAQGAIRLGWLAGIVACHVNYGNHSPAWLGVLDVLTAMASGREAYQRTKGWKDHEARFAAIWQPTILSTLLMAIEIIGVTVDPLIFALATQIPSSWPPLAIGFILFFLTAWVSHIADNALASRVFISVPVALMEVFGLQIASLLAACVATGALFGGFLLVPANLPNFYISRMFKVGPKTWARTAWRLYPSGVAYIIWILVIFWIWG